MKQIVLNGCYGCFGLSECAIELYRDYAALYIEEFDERYDYHIADYADYDGYETLKTSVNENILRSLIKEEDEDKIVEYVMGARA